MIDLHTHSSASDGQYSPAGLMRLAAARGLTAIALTDHDTVAGIPEAQSTAQALGIRFLPGIEISVKAPVRELHLLGYRINPECPELLEMCAWFQEQRRIREKRIFSYLAARGVRLEREQVERLAEKGLVGRPHFARAMVEAGYVATAREAFDKHLAVPEFDAIERPKPTPEAGIRCILAAGGVPVLAHPVQLNLSSEQLDHFVGELKAAGLAGIECYYSTHTPKQTQEYLFLAEKYGLTVTGGSDFHGEEVKPEIQLGSGINGSLHIEDAEILHWEDTP